MSKLSQALKEALTKHYIAETETLLLYRNMSSWLSNNDYPGHAHYMKVHSKEEDLHSTIFFDYLCDRDEAPFISGTQFSTDLDKHEWEGVVQLFEEVLEQEYATTKSIYNLYEIAENEKDYTTKNFLKYFIAEQKEEEETFELILQKYKMLEKSTEKYFLMDEELAQRADDLLQNPTTAGDI